MKNKDAFRKIVHTNAYKSQRRTGLIVKRIVKDKLMNDVIFMSHQEVAERYTMDKHFKHKAFQEIAPVENRWVCG